MMLSDSDSSFITTYSQSERIETSIKEDRRREKEVEEERDRRREESFKRIYDAEINTQNFRSSYAGLNFLKYTHRKIKFTFVPSKLEFVSDRYVFYCTLWYKRHIWKIKRNTFPLDCKPNIYNLFYAKGGRGITDRKINVAIDAIYDLLWEWARKEHCFRVNIYERFRSGEDIILDGIEEEMFLDAEEIDEIHRKRKAVWRRMLPPPR